MDDLNWPKMLNNVLTDKWYQLKNTLVMKDLVDFLIQRRVVTLDYWMALKAKPISESERTEEFLFHVMKFNREKYNELLNALEMLGRSDLVKALSVVKDNCPQRARRHTFIGNDQGDAVKPKTSRQHGDETAATRQKSSSSKSSRVTNGSSRSEHKQPTTKFQSTIMQKVYQQALRHYETGMIDGKTSHSLMSPRKAVDESKVEKTMFIKRETKNVDSKIESKSVAEDETSEQKERIASATSRQSAESARKREVLLETRESLINTREQDLKNRAKRLEEHEMKLRKKEIDTKSQEVISEKNGEEIENEHKPTDLNDQLDNTRSPIMTPIRSREIKHHLQTVQTDIQHLKGNNEVLQEKMEDQKCEMEGLNTRIETLENEKSEAERIRLAEVGMLKVDLTNTKLSYDKIVKDMRKEIEYKESQCQEMKAEIHDLESICKNLSGRLQLVEEDKSKTENELQEHTREMYTLKHDLEQRECEIVNLKKDLEQKVTANSRLSKQVVELKSENCSLLAHRGRFEKYNMQRESEVLDLKHELTKLRTDNRKLEQEKKLLLGRFVKPDWTHRRNSTLHK